MAIELIAVGETWKFTVPTDTKDPTIWELRILDQLVIYRLSVAILDSMPEKKEIEKSQRVPVEHHEALRETCRFGIAGWKNLKDGAEPVEYRSEEADQWGRKYQAVPDDLLQRIPILTVQILGMEIVRGNNLSEEGKKKLLSFGEPESIEKGQNSSTSPPGRQSTSGK